MNEEQKQAVADAKIKLSNLSITSNGQIYGNFTQNLTAVRDALLLVTPQAHESVQNGTADDENAI